MFQSAVWQTGHDDTTQWRGVIVKTLPKPKRYVIRVLAADGPDSNGSVVIRPADEVEIVKNTRQDRGLQLFHEGCVAFLGDNKYLVKSQSEDRNYEVDLHQLKCQCQDRRNNHLCKHLIAANEFRNGTGLDDCLRHVIMHNTDWDFGQERVVWRKKALRVILREYQYKLWAIMTDESREVHLFAGCMHPGEWKQSFMPQDYTLWQQVCAAYIFKQGDLPEIPAHIKII